jgi:hypothetical protein
MVAPLGAPSTVRTSGCAYVGVKVKVHCIVTDIVPRTRIATVAGPEVDEVKLLSPA